MGFTLQNDRYSIINFSIFIDFSVLGWIVENNEFLMIPEVLHNFYSTM
jgi:hypothetical protein